MRTPMYGAMVVMALALGSSAGAQNNNKAAASIRGVVLDENDKPVARATVSIDNATKVVQADVSGRFQLTEIAAGRHVLTARAVGYQPVNQPIVIKTGETLDVDIVLTKIATLETNKVIGLSAARAEFEDRRSSARSLHSH